MHAGMRLFSRIQLVSDFVWVGQVTKHLQLTPAEPNSSSTQNQSDRNSVRQSPADHYLIFTLQTVSCTISRPLFYTIHQKQPNTASIPNYKSSIYFKLHKSF